MATPYFPYKAFKFVSANGSLYIIWPRETPIDISLKFFRIGYMVVISHRAISYPCIFKTALSNVNPVNSSTLFKVNDIAAPVLTGGVNVLPKK